MDLNNVLFNQNQLAELYGQHLVSTDSTTATVSPPEITKEKRVIPFKGKNKKGMLWMVHEPGSLSVTDEAFSFLTQIVEACRMNLDDIALVNIQNGDYSVKEVIGELKPAIIILCGIPYNQLPFPMEEYVLYPLTKQSYFVCDDLTQLKNDKAKKSKLWLALKELLSL